MTTKTAPARGHSFGLMPQEHVVTKEDVEAGVYTDIYYAAPHSMRNPKTDETVSGASFHPVYLIFSHARSDSVLDERGLYSAHKDADPIDAFSPIRASLRERLLSATSAGATARAFRFAQSLWRAELDRILQTGYGAGEADLRTLIAGERVAFDEFPETHREAFTALIYPDRPERVEEIIAMLLEQETLEVDALWFAHCQIK